MLFTSSEGLFSFSRYLNFCLDFLVKQKKRLDWKEEANFKICDVATWLINNCNLNKNILLNISRSKSNQTKKFCQLINNTKQTFFFKNHAEYKPGRQFQNSFFAF